MTADYRPRRSVLFMPGSNARALTKARTLDCDAVIIDLEDAVAPDAKPDARQAACQTVRDGGFGHREVAVRVNGMDTPWHADDLAAVCAAGPDAVVVPKVETAAQVEQLAGALAAQGTSERTKLWVMLETPRAILDAAAIAAASPRLEVLVLGTNDLVKELGAHPAPGRAALQPLLGLALLGVRSAGKLLLDGVYNDVKDPDGFAAECLQAWEFGFDGKTLIHPGQIAAANAQWAPTPEQVADAHELIETFDAALAAGSGVATHHGRLIENLHVEQARRILAVASAVSAR